MCNYPGVDLLFCGSTSGHRGTCKHIIHVMGRETGYSDRKHDHLYLLVLLVHLNLQKAPT